MNRWVAALIVLMACNRPPAEKPATALPNANAGSTPKSVEAKAPIEPKVEPIARDLAQIKEDGTLRVLFTFNSTGYLIYRGETLGYEYELISRFAREEKLRLVPVVVRDTRQIFNQLNRGEGDIVAAQLLAPANETEVMVTDGLYSTPPAVVQRATPARAPGQTPAVAKALRREDAESGDNTIEVRARLISRPSELAGERVHMSRSSPYFGRLIELDTQLPGDIEVVELEESPDRLIQRLAEGEIGYTVAAENFASLKATEYTNLIVKPIVGPPQQVVWAVRRNSPALHDRLDQWLDAQRKSGLLNVVYRKYFLNRRAYSERAVSPYLTAKTGTLSAYDAWFREYAKIPGWDWRLLAAQAYQESRFNARAKSWAGATGLMQIMPRTARELRINPNDSRQSIEGASRYLWKFDDHFKKVIPSEKERIKFILASYNVGLGHVEDARRLAEKNGDDPAKWDDVSYWLIRKSKRAVYNDPVVRYGFARGTEPVNYVAAILDRFENYKLFVEDEAPLASGMH